MQSTINTEIVFCGQQILQKQDVSCQATTYHHIASKRPNDLAFAI